MRTRKISIMPHGIRFLLVSLVLAVSFITSASHLAYAHTFSTSESAEFLSLVDQIRAETGLITMNLENNNNVTLAQAHSEKASSLLNNSTLDEIREVNNRIADSLETGLEQLEGNVTTFPSASQGQIPQDRLQSINQTVVSLNDTLAEAVTVRVESEQQNNATTWAMALADLVNVVLSNYGNATGAPFDLTDMSNLASGMEGIQMSGNSSSNNTMTMTTNATSSMSNMTATIVNVEAYQSAQYLANNTTLRLFNDLLKPLTINSNETSSDNNNATPMAQQGQNNITPANNTTSNIDSLEAKLLQLKDNINGKVTPAEIMTTVHLGIHPILMQLYGLTM
jgi:hypothetical protein